MEEKRWGGEEHGEGNRGMATLGRGRGEGNVYGTFLFHSYFHLIPLPFP